jgi:predicted transcriptional regulator
MSSNAIVLSIRPQYAKKIFDGSKKVELRRIRPKQIRKGSLVFIYASSPAQSLVGAFKVDEIVEKPLSELWSLVQDIAGVAKKEFYDYYQGVNTGIGIFFSEVWSLREPIKIQDWQEQGIHFNPPQGFRYATAEELASLQVAELGEDFEIAEQSSLWSDRTNKSKDKSG